MSASPKPFAKLSTLRVLLLLGGVLSCRERQKPVVPPSLEPTSPFATADSLRLLGRPAEALVHYRRLRDSLALTGDSATWWKAELWWGAGQMWLGHGDSAEQGLNRALLLARGDRRQEAWTRVVTSTFLDLQGRFDTALVEVMQAQELARETGDDDLEAEVHHQLARVHSFSGRNREAFLVDSTALARRRELGGKPRAVLARQLNSIGIDYHYQGRLTKAEQAFEEALAIYEELGNDDGVARVLTNLSNVYGTTGDFERSTELLTRAIQHGKRAGLSQLSLGVKYNNLGYSYLMVGNRAEALRHLQQALQLGRSGQQPYLQILALANLGRIELAEGDTARANQTWKAALKLADSLGYDQERASLRIYLATAAAGRDSRVALRWADEAVGLARSLEAPESEFDALHARGVALEAAGDQAAAIATNRSALDLLESWRGRVALGDLRMGIGESRLDPYESLVRLLLDQGRGAEAFEIAERSRARLLLELMTDRETESPRDSAEETLLRELRAEFSVRAASQPDERSAVDQRIASLTDTLATLEAAAKRRDPAAGAARYPRPVTLAEARAGLVRRDRGLLAFFWGNREVYGWWVGPDSVRAVRLGSSDSLGPLIDFLRSSIESSRDGPDWIAPARRVFQTLIAPLHPGKESEILVIPDGPLAHIPIEVLVPGNDSTPWGASRHFVYGPSASVLLALIRAPKTGPWQHAVLAVGNPTAGSTQAHASFRDGSDADPGPLPNASAEARGIRDLFRSEGADLLIGRKASVKRWRSLEPARYRYLHFAAHARVHDRRPERTHLLLADGSLDLAAIRDLHLRAELVTLSACETALGRRVRGEGIIGLPHAFLAAGARGVLVTLWRIEDQSAADFMREFYQHLHDGEPPAEALRAVRSKWISSGGPMAHPARWAPFVLVGGISEEQRDGGAAGQ